MLSGALPVLVKVKLAVVGVPEQTVTPPKVRLEGTESSGPRPVPLSATSTRGRFRSLLLIAIVPLCAPTDAATKLGRKRTVTSTLGPGAMLSGRLRSTPDGLSTSCVTLNCGLLLVIALTLSV